MSTNKSYKSAFLFVTTLFFLWGFITVLVDSLIPRLKEVFELSNFQSGLIQLAFFLAYFVFSIPSSQLLAKIGYKKGIILGLLVIGFGCFMMYPAAYFRIYGVFLIAVFVIGAGLSTLQVAANPYVATLGPEESASSRLNLSQAFNSLGTTIAPTIGALFILSSHVKNEEQLAQLNEVQKEAYFATEASAVQSPFLILGAFAVLLGVVFLFVKLPKLLQKVSNKGYKKLLSHKPLMYGALGIFVYVGAEVSIGSYLVDYFMSMELYKVVGESDFMMGIANSVADLFSKSFDDANPKSLLGIFVTLYWSGAMIGRFVGAYLTRIIAPAKVLSVFAILAITMIVLSMTTTGLVSMWAILAVGLFNSIMFPTIFTLAIDGLDELKPQASGILCTAIVGGAVIPPLYGLFSDLQGFKVALILVLVCYAYIMYYGYTKRKYLA
ncbi:sugar MFS transporter [Kordia sp.]|uniref:sugar MFS transporter n=1 Tax=Kordia sp. TaxID=1965332 RepID=UPI0025C48D2D|nr:sugar MFS transporter [Kordia sp.]MCH2196041.1 sugar MFS transporter [Kordia sp.]